MFFSFQFETGKKLRAQRSKILGQISLFIWIVSLNSFFFVLLLLFLVIQPHHRKPLVVGGVFCDLLTSSTTNCDKFCLNESSDWSSVSMFFKNYHFKSGFSQLIFIQIALIDYQNRAPWTPLCQCVIPQNKFALSHFQKEVYMVLASFSEKSHLETKKANLFQRIYSENLQSCWTVNKSYIKWDFEICENKLPIQKTVILIWSILHPRCTWSTVRTVSTFFRFCFYLNQFFLEKSTRIKFFFSTSPLVEWRVYFVMFVVVLCLFV